MPIKRGPDNDTSTQDRRMAVSIKFIGYYAADGDPRLTRPDGTKLPAGYYGSATYTQLPTLTLPDMPNAIDSDGTINLPGVEPNSGWNEACDIVFVIDGSSGVRLKDADPNAPLSPVTWAHELSNDLAKSAMLCGTRIESPPGSGFYNIIPNPLMTTSWTSSDKIGIMLDDSDPSGNTYYYRPAIIIPAAGDYYISIDPGITIRPPKPR